MTAGLRTVAVLCLLSGSVYFVTPQVVTAQGIGVEQIQVQTKKRLAVLDFEFASTGLTGLGLYGAVGPAKGVSDLLTNRLAQSGAFIMVERSRINQILAEQNLGAAGRIEPATAAQIGRLLGADAVIIGSITQFNVQESRSHINIGFFGISTASQRQKADVKLSARIVNTSTGEILGVAEGTGTAEQSSGGATVYGIGGENFTDAADQLLAAAAEQAVAQLTEGIVRLEPTLAALPPLLPDVIAIVADVSPGRVVLNKGAKDGLRPGMVMSVERVVKEIKDPQTGKVLRRDTQPVGRVQLTEVDAVSAVGRILSGRGLKVGDAAKPVPN
ncbi:MAG: CsgG/HfaB family protein [Gloeomargarita sp. SKYBB_i_bin120]|nr:CsgG/HfaB family protein [Gloeomargarita sp. SKYG98]MCS7291845.1 CsgG/HfaB family protein [Gloeomargarita sp. SKYB120]MDW8177405.1 CsgG/HfaB family protein [Gloeomargarita sp. SKYBB_i_bin120]